MSGYWPKNQPVTSKIGAQIAPAPTGFSENYDAAIDSRLFSNNPLSQYNTLSEAYAERIRVIEQSTGKKLVNPLLASPPGIVKDVLVPNGTVDFRRQAIDDFEKQVSELSVVDGQVPISGDQMMQDLRQVSQDVDQNADNVSAGATFSGSLGAMAGDVVGAMMDPAMIITLPFSAAKGAGILKTAIQEALIGGVTEAAYQPQVQVMRADRGLEAGLGVALENIAGGAIGAGVLGGAAKGFEVGIQALTGRRLIKQFNEAVKAPTIEQKTARDVIDRQADIVNSSPFDSRLPESQGEHTGRLAAAMRSLDQDGVLPDLPAAAAPLSPVKMERPVKQIDGVISVFNPKDIEVDAKSFQFKEGGDDAGVTERLKGITEWDPVKAGNVLVYQYADGRQFIADGHQRLGLAKRLSEAAPDSDVQLYGHLFREDEGFTPETVRAIAAMKNIAEGTGTAIDAAKVLRVAPERIRELPPRSALVRQAQDMIDLSDHAFGMVVNEVVDANHAAIVGRLVKDQDAQLAIMDVLAKTEPSNMVQAEAIVRQAMEFGTVTDTQMGLFGEETLTTSLFSERAKVMDNALKKLRQDAKVFETLVRNEDRIAAEGNVLSRDTNAARASADSHAVQMIQTLANRKGSLSDALTQAARRAANDGKYTGATNDFVDAVRSAIERGDFDGLPTGGNGRNGEVTGQTAPRISEPTDSALNDQTLNLFDDPAGNGVKDQSAALEAEILRDNSPRLTDQPGEGDLLDMEIPTGERIDPETGDISPTTRTIREILDELDQDAADLDAIGKCGNP